MSIFRTGFENLLENPPAFMRSSRLAMLVNPASVDRRFLPSAKVLDQKFPGRLKAVFTPQHGFFAAQQDNMIESPDTTDPFLGVPAFSLYSQTRVPTDRAMELFDTALVDIQDVGTRVYTFIYTVSYLMEAAKKHGRKVVILDRPNPIGGELVEGNLLAPEFVSFVGRYPIPMRHGLTMGEIARLMNEEFGIGCDLEVIPMTGWERRHYWEETGLAWIPPSPNLPTVESAVTYPGQVIWEGTNVSEARGTTLPFTMLGAPYLEWDEVLEDLGGPEQVGAILRPTAFEPTSNKWKGELCKGFSIHVTDREKFRPVSLAWRLMASIYKRRPKSFAWKTPPYEYEYEKWPIDMIFGTDRARLTLEKGNDPKMFEESWDRDERSFFETRRPFLIYR